MKKNPNNIIHESAYESQESISLNDDSVIEQYGGLDFSDEQSRSNDQFSSGDAGHHQLSEDKLKFLGVDKFPGSYAHQAIDHSISKFRQTNTKEQSHFVDNAKYINQARSRRQKSQSSRNGSVQWSESSQDHQRNPNTEFNIQSFLNSQPVAKYPSKNQGKQVMNQKRQENTNSLARRKQINPKNQRPPYIPTKQKYTPVYHVLQKQADSSLTLVTLPEPDERVIQHSKRASQAVSKMNKEQVELTNNFNVRFQQAKLNFMDSFLPEGMKIGNNPYKFWKYTNEKTKNLSYRIL